VSAKSAKQIKHETKAARKQNSVLEFALVHQTQRLCFKSFTLG